MRTCACTCACPCTCACACTCACICASPTRYIALNMCMHMHMHMHMRISDQVHRAQHASRRAAHSAHRQRRAQVQPRCSQYIVSASSETSPGTTSLTPLSCDSHIAHTSRTVRSVWALHDLLVVVRLLLLGTNYPLRTICLLGTCGGCTRSRGAWRYSRRSSPVRRGG